MWRRQHRAVHEKELPTARHDCDTGYAGLCLIPQHGLGLFLLVALLYLFPALQYRREAVRIEVKGRQFSQAKLGG